MSAPAASRAALGGPAALYSTIDGTWPAARFHHLGPWLLREGRGGGKRVSAATAIAPVTDDDIAPAETAMRAFGQRPLFMIREADDALDAHLAARGYRIVDPVNAYASPVAALTDMPMPKVTAFATWEPLAITTEIWATGGIGPDRVAVMARAETKTSILARWNDKPAGAAFVGLHDGVAMVHAVEVLDHARRQGVAGWIMRRAAFWAAGNQAHTMAVLCTQANAPANLLYQRLGFDQLCGYHYRQHPEDT